MDTTLKHYFDALPDRAPLSDGEFDRLAARIRNGSAAAVDRVVDAHLHLVIAAAADLGPGHRRCRLSAMDLIAEGCVALIGAARGVGRMSRETFADRAGQAARRRMRAALSGPDEG